MTTNARVSGHDAHGVNVKNVHQLHSEGIQHRTFRDASRWASESREKMQQSATGFRRTGRQTGASLRSMSTEVRKGVDDTLRESESRVRKALERNVNQVRGLASALRDAVKLADQELSILHSKREELADVRAREEKLLSLSESRREARSRRPEQEKVSDDAQRKLINQVSQAERNVSDMKRCEGKADEVAAKLQEVLDNMRADLHDKEQAMDLDQRCLSLDDAGSEGNLKLTLERKAATYPATWAKNTANEVQEAASRRQDSIRLRSAIDRLLTRVRSARRKANREVEEALESKIASNASERDNLKAQLDSVKGELEQAVSSKEDLERCLEQKDVPLTLSRQRFAMRQERPEREQVHDMVESALSEEFNELRQMRATLEGGINSTNKEIAKLERERDTIENSLEAKEGAVEADKEAKNVGHRRPDTAISDLISEAPSSQPSTSVLLDQRVDAMEQELAQARSERQNLEQQLSHVREQQRAYSPSPLPQ